MMEETAEETRPKEAKALLGLGVDIWEGLLKHCPR